MTLVSDLEGLYFCLKLFDHLTHVHRSTLDFLVFLHPLLQLKEGLLIEVLVLLGPLSLLLYLKAHLLIFVLEFLDLDLRQVETVALGGLIRTRVEVILGLQLGERVWQGNGGVLERALLQEGLLVLFELGQNLVLEALGVSLYFLVNQELLLEGLLELALGRFQVAI